jgi:hypothetical protein
VITTASGLSPILAVITTSIVSSSLSSAVSSALWPMEINKHGKVISLKQNTNYFKGLVG